MQPCIMTSVDIFCFQIFLKKWKRERLTPTPYIQCSLDNISCLEWEIGFTLLSLSSHHDDKGMIEKTLPQKFLSGRVHNNLVCHKS